MEPINHLHKTEKRWFAIYTKYKCEKYVIDLLSRKGIKAYTPIIESTKKYDKRLRVHKLPLLHCYAFVHIDASEYISVLETDYVLKFIKQRKDLLRVEDKEINLLKHIVGEYQGNVELVQDQYEKGEKVEVVAGRLTGLNGIVIDEQRNKDLLVELDTIGIKLRIQFKAENLRAAVS
jgi:transcription antitermination factor NusG